MALIEADHPAATGSDLQYWQDEKTNTRIQIFELDKQILALEREIKESYTFNSGQTSISIRRHNLAELIAQKKALLDYAQRVDAIIDSLENPGGGFTQVVPY
jgi:uncharacterized protein YdeI (YjbR/CyaY-like superfamily)